MGEPFVVLGIILVIIATNLQPWHHRFRNPIIAVGACLAGVGLAAVSPKTLLLSVPLVGFALIIWHLICHWSDYHGQKQPTAQSLQDKPPNQRQPVGFRVAMGINAPAGSVARMMEEGFEGTFLTGIEPLDVPESPPAAPQAVEDLHIPDPVIDGRLMVLRKDGQLPPPIRGSNPG